MPPEKIKQNKKVILRIRCPRDVFRNFKRIAVDYTNYAETLTTLMESHLKYVQLCPAKKEESGTYR